MENQNQTVAQVVELTQKILDNWPLLKEPLETQTSVVRENIISRILEASKVNDQVEEIFVVEQLYPVVVDVLNTATLPDSYPYPAEFTKEQVDADFSAMCKTINVRPTSIDQLALPEAATLDPLITFVRLVSKGMKVRSYLLQWADEIGLNEILQQKGSPIRPSFQELNTLYLFFSTLEAISRKAAMGIQTPGAAGGGLFVPGK